MLYIQIIQKLQNETNKLIDMRTCETPPLHCIGTIQINTQTLSVCTLISSRMNLDSDYCILLVLK